MKKLLLILVLFISGNGLFAQIGNPFSESNWFEVQLANIQKMTNPSAGIVERRAPTEQKQRVTQQSSYENVDGIGLALLSSTTYTYSGDRGSQFNYYNMDFDYNENFLMNYAPLYIGIEESSVMDVLASTMEHAEYDYLPPQTAPFSTVLSKEVGTYRPDNKLSLVTYFEEGAKIAEYTNTYNSDGALESTTMTVFLPDGTTMESMKFDYTYNSNSTKVVSIDLYYNKDMDSDLEKAKSTTYEYNSADQLTKVRRLEYHASVTTLTERFELTYNSNGQIASYTVYEASDDGTTMQKEKERSYTYSASCACYASFQMKEYEDGVLISATEAQTTIGANNLPEKIVGTATTYDSSGNPSSSPAQVDYTYNSFNNPTEISVSIGGEIIFKNVFVYEAYTLGINDLAKNLNFEIYPNPVSDKIIIGNKNGKFNGNWKISLLDIQGRTVFEQEQNLHRGKNVVPLEGLTAGMYFLTLENPEHVKISRKIVKQ